MLLRLESMIACYMQVLALASPALVVILTFQQVYINKLFRRQTTRCTKDRPKTIPLLGEDCCCFVVVVFSNHCSSPLPFVSSPCVCVVCWSLFFCRNRRWRSPSAVRPGRRRYPRPTRASSSWTFPTTIRSPCCGTSCCRPSTTPHRLTSYENGFVIAAQAAAGRQQHRMVWRRRKKKVFAHSCCRLSGTTASFDVVRFQQEETVVVFFVRKIKQVSSAGVVFRAECLPLPAAPTVKTPPRFYQRVEGAKSLPCEGLTD